MSEIYPMETRPSNSCNAFSDFEEKFRNSPDAVVLMDSMRRVLWINQPFECLTGYRLQDLIGRTPANLYSRPADFHASGQGLYNTALSLAGQSYQMNYLGKDGSCIETNTRSWALSDADGAIIGSAMVLHDRTAARCSERVIRQVFEIVTDQNGSNTKKVGALLKVACTMLGMPMGFIGLSMHDHISVTHLHCDLGRSAVSKGFKASACDYETLHNPYVLYEYRTRNTNRAHPLMPGTGLQSYIGVQLWIEGKTTGTLSFLSAKRREKLPPHLVTLLTDIGVAIAHIIAHDERVRHLERAATEDWLTGAASNRQFRLDLNRIFRSNHCGRASASIILMDVDHFKAVNDCHGHDMGDRVLREIATLMKSLLGQKIPFYRIGGEEFGVILPNFCKDKAAAVAEKLRSRLADATAKDEGFPQITASFGVAQLTEDTACQEAWIKAADIALYKAKHSGRNRVAVSCNINTADDQQGLSESKYSPLFPASQNSMTV